MPSPFKAQLDDWTINILDIGDSVKSNVIQHEFINTDGALLEALGNAARVVRFKTFWFGAHEDPTVEHSPNYSEHYGFLAKITNSFVSHTLVHPKYGTLTGKISNVTIVHNDTQSYVEIEVEFIEDGLKTDTSMISSRDMATYGAQQYANVANGQLSDLSSSLSNGGLGDLATRAIDTAQSISSQVTTYTSKVRAFVKEADEFCSMCDSFVTTITQPALSVLTAINYVGSIPSKIIGTIQNAADRVEALVSSATSTPLQLVQSFAASWSSLVGSITSSSYSDLFALHASAIGAAKMGSMLSSCYAADESNRARLARTMTSPSFDANGRRVGTPAAMIDIMSSTEIERSLYEVREAIEAVLTIDRTNQPLKDLALALVRHVDEIKLRKQQVRTIEVPSMPLHVLCVQLGQPYQQVEQYVKINPAYPCPTFVQGPVDVYTVV